MKLFFKPLFKGATFFLLLSALIQLSDNYVLSHKCNHWLSGAVLDKEKQAPLNKIGVLLFDNNNILVKKVFTDRSGRFDFGVVNCNKAYRVKTESKLYNSEEISVIISSKTEITERKLELKPL
ncbi:hypothetical protein [Flavobacterium sp.]|uniref:hypothetical protein n=1 Tax=Flavobacterium sp. TaxID=239 RepID=UPI0008B15945|nr:hypothetical protein [Flavobacterium sp.]OGS61247.1 MAG: hypothetical protein A2X07_06325 [Flavobacteria bacterium GWF1_32_7]HBD25663.1 hypothetical protein [Flavobacterium sp.]